MQCLQLPQPRPRHQLHVGANLVDLPVVRHQHVARLGRVDRYKNWIAAGAREVMNSLMEELAQTDRSDIRVVTSGCMGMCSSEPNVTVEIQEAEPIVYQKMEPNRMRQVFKRHVLLGEVQTDFALGKM